MDHDVLQSVFRARITTRRLEHKNGKFPETTESGWIRIGGLTTWTDIIRTPLLGGNLKTAAWSAGLSGWGQAKAWMSGVD